MIQNDAFSAGHRSRLRTKFLTSGLEALADHEVVELILTLAIPRSDVKPQAKRLIVEFGNLRGILEAPVGRLCEVQGVGIVAATALKIIQAVATTYVQQSLIHRQYLGDFKAFEDLWKMRFSGQPNEAFEVAFLDSSLRLLHDGIERLSEGTLDRTAVYPRRIVQIALRREAAAIVLAHNHPNGIARPTEQDRTITRTIEHVASAVGITVMDHVIVTSDEVFSFKRAGIL
jgi:DNA repair protein RadC